MSVSTVDNNIELQYRGTYSINNSFANSHISSNIVFAYKLKFLVRLVRIEYCSLLF
jgi:hypothetical protein